jgi:GNAT superfamily N-acetyltransferase
VITEQLLSGDTARAVVDSLASLRLTIFREYPYLYDGKREDELTYVRIYADTADACVIVAEADGDVIGAATGIPLKNEDEQMLRAFVRSGIDTEERYYVGELLCYPEYRGKGLGTRLLARMETHVRSLERYRSLVCATVIRPDDDPSIPAGYISIRCFLDHHGFRMLPAVTAIFSWLETDGVVREHPMQFWIKELCR